MTLYRDFTESERHKLACAATDCLERGALIDWGVREYGDKAVMVSVTLEVVMDADDVKAALKERG